MRNAIFFCIALLILGGIPDALAQAQTKAPINYMDLEETPKFKGEGIEAFSFWVSPTIKYPPKAKKQIIQGTVLVRFTINTKGKVINAYIEDSSHPLLDAEALRVVRKSPKWAPAKINGQHVMVSYTIPVIFKLR